MSDPKAELRQALTVLNNYYGGLARQIADEIIEHKEDFEAKVFGDADSIIEKYAMQVQQLGAVYGLLRWEALLGEKPQGREPLAKDEFRCFGCGEVIQPNEVACPLCGWTWR